ncbi:MAG: hypothetical protein ACREX3_14555, partial [Gammaproteobacteria bacterium]
MMDGELSRLRVWFSRRSVDIGRPPKALRDSFEEYKYVDKGDAGEWIQGLVKKYRRNDREVKKHE